MTTHGLLARIQPVHDLTGRVRFRYQFHTGTELDGPGLAQLVSQWDGVEAARASRHAQSLIVSFDPEQTSSQALQQYLSALPGDAGTEIAQQEKPAPSQELRTAGKTLFSSAAVLLGLRFLPAPLQLGLSLFASAPVLREALHELVRQGITANVLEGVAVTISLLRGEYAVANTTNFLLALGEYLTATTSRRSDTLLRDLLSPSHPTVWVMRQDQEVEIQAEDVVIGDTVVVASGSVMPIDGTILRGTASIDESALTGEATPVVKQRGDHVLSGALVQEGRLEIYAEHVGRETVSARIADYVENSLAAKSQTQMRSARLADKLVPTILSVASLAFLLSRDIQRPVSVLQADYSCALKLATPIAFRFAMYGAGKAGILIKGADALERLNEADTFVFDKTGTLTTGVLTVTDAITFNESFSKDDLIWLAASLEEHYAFHPLAMAVVEAARSTDKSSHFDHQEVEFIVAHGVASMIDGHRIVVGSQHFVEEDEQIDCSAHRETIDTLYAQGKTVVFVGYGEHLLGILGLEDQLRPSAVETIARLRQSGAKRLIMLTGDRRDKAAEISQALGLDDFRAELLPEDKAGIIDELTRKGARIAFVGDGINDAPALAGSHVGVAMQRGADIARMTGDVVLLEDDIAGLVEAVHIARDVMKLIDVSFKLTIGLNTSILVAASLGWLSPLATAILHNGSTIAILLNVLRQRIGSYAQTNPAPAGYLPDPANAT